jgi:hypothetical protein
MAWMTATHRARGLESPPAGQPAGGTTSTGENRSMFDKIRVLFLAADPFRAGAAPRLDEEVRAIEQAVGEGPAREALELVPYFATRTRDVQDALLLHEPQIVHFTGHGDAPGAICLADEHGRAQRVDREALRGLLGVLQGSVRIVVLSGCDTSPTVDALGEVADYTIGINSSPSDGSSLHFAQAFYSALAMGRNVLTAFERGLSEMEMEGRPESAMPVRRIRRGVNLDATLVPRPPPREGNVHPGRAQVHRSTTGSAG